MKHIPRKRFGQHFLTDRQVIADIISVIAPQADNLMVEIGPGLGAITKPLLQTLRHLHVVELDRDIVARLHRDYAPERLTVHSCDALKFDFGSLGACRTYGDQGENSAGRGQILPVLPGNSHSIAQKTGEIWTGQADLQPIHHKSDRLLGSPLRVVGNLPYNISTPLLFHLASFVDRIEDMHFMLQLEVVERMVAEPSTPAYGRLSVMLQYFFIMENLLHVPPQAFSPPPKVESAVVRMLPWRDRPFAANSVQTLAAVVTAAFAMRRKTLRNTLHAYLSGADFEQLAIDPGLRAENLGLPDFVRIANHVEGSI